MGDIGGSKAATSSTDQSATTSNEQIGASEGSIAVRGAEGSGSDTVVNITPAISEDFLSQLVDGVGGAVDRNFDTTQQALDTLGNVKALEVSGGATETNKTILIGLALGLGALVVVKMTK